MTPRIAITTSYAGDGSPDPDADDYRRAVERHGGRPVLLPNDYSAVAAAVDGVGGVIVSGGVDVDPARYGGRRLAAVDVPDPDRDAFELALFGRLRTGAIPTLCLCRGLQVANVAFGGTLIEDLATEFGAGRIDHRPRGSNGKAITTMTPEHRVRAQPGSALAKLVGAHEFATNAIHHQAVRNVAPELRAVAWTNDGIIEALEANFDHPFFIAVQWHPELLAGDPVSARLFDGLIAAARLRAEAQAGPALDGAQGGFGSDRQQR